MPAPTNGHAAELGSSVPICTPHAVSVSLPTWKDNADYELGLDRVHARLTTGYPRFFIHQDIQKLAEICRAAHAPSAQGRCILFPSEKAANLCWKFVADQALKSREVSAIRLARPHSTFKKSTCKLLILLFWETKVWRKRSIVENVLWESVLIKPQGIMWMPKPS